MSFDAMGTLRAIRDDEELTTNQLALLMCAVLRADNRTGKVRMSIEGLAKDAKVSYKTGKTHFKDPKVTKYFDRIEGSTRSKNMWFRSTPIDSGNGYPNEEVDSGNGGHHSGNCRHDSGNGYPPSTSSSTFTSTEAAEAAGKEDLLNYGERDRHLNFKEAVGEAEEVFNSFKSRYLAVTGKPLVALFDSVKFPFTDMLKVVTKDRASQLVDAWFETDQADYSADRFARAWSRLHEAEVETAKDRVRRARLTKETKVRTEAWQERKKKMGTTQRAENKVFLTLDEQRKAFAELPPLPPKEEDEDTW